MTAATVERHRFHDSVLREYDIRGVVGETLGAADGYAIGRSFAAMALGKGPPASGVVRIACTSASSGPIRLLEEWGGVPILCNWLKRYWARYWAITQRPQSPGLKAWVKA